MNIRRVFSRRCAKKERRTHRALHGLTIAALSGAILLTSGLASAEIYRWKDANGTVRYSNRPPDDPSLLLDALPLKQPPSEQSQKNSSYYLQSQGKETLQQEFSGNKIERFVLPSNVVDNALTNAPSVAEKPSQQSANDDAMTALLSRMNDLEQRLQQATANQTDWEQKYQQAMLQTEQLEEQNRLLRQTISEMQATLQQFQEMIASSQKITVIQPLSHIAKVGVDNNELNTFIAAQSEQIQQQQREIAQLRQEVQALKTNAATPSLSSGAASVSASPKLVTRGRIRVVERKTRRQEFTQISKADTHLFLSQR